MRWEQDLFKQTEITVGNPLTTDDQTTKVVLFEPTDKEMNSSIQRLYRDKFPELTSIKDEFEVIEQITKIKSEHEGTKLSTKKIIKVQHDKNTKDIWEKLKRIREETLTDKRVALHHTNNITPEKLQMMTENKHQGGHSHHSKQQRNGEGQDNVWYDHQRR